MKRLVGIVTLFFALFLIAGCSNQASPDTPPPQTEDPRESVELFDETFYPITDVTFEDINGEYMCQLTFTSARNFNWLTDVFGESFYQELEAFLDMGFESQEARIEISDGEFILNVNKDNKPFMIEKIAGCSLENGIFTGNIEDEEKKEEIFIGTPLKKPDYSFRQTKSIEGVVHNQDGKTFVTGKIIVESSLKPDTLDSFFHMFTMTYKFEVEIK